MWALILPKVPAYTIGCKVLWSFNARVAESCDWHDHDVFQFILCRDQNGRIVTPEGEIHFAPTKTILVPPKVRHQMVIDTGKISYVKTLCFPQNDVVRFLSPLHIAMLNSLSKLGVSVAEHAHQEQWLKDLGETFIEGFDVDDVWAQRIQWGTIGLLLTLHAKEQYKENEYSALRHKEKIQQIAGWIEKNLNEDITIEHAAKKFAISRSLLTREFRAYTGKSFVEFCNSRRVQIAAAALVTRDDPIAQVAMDSGFSNLSHFHRQFKDHFGMTPAVFRRTVLEVSDPGNGSQ
jgi:AraC-like DNA-binding protein